MGTSENPAKPPLELSEGISQEVGQLIDEPLGKDIVVAAALGTHVVDAVAPVLHPVHVARGDVPLVVDVERLV